MHFLPDDDDDEEEDADHDGAVLKLMLVLVMMRMTAMKRMATIRSKRELNICIFSQPWRRFWKKEDLLANQITWKAILFSLVLGKISSIFFNFQIHHLAWPSLGIQGGSNVSKYFVNGC